METIEELRRQLEEERHERKKERHRLAEAEKLAAQSRPQTIQQYFEACHRLDLAAEVITDRSLTTQGETTDPTGRIFPRRIVPWDEFEARQEEIWHDLSISDALFSTGLFPSQHQIEYVKSLLKPISSEIGLRDSQRNVVENAVEKLVDAVSTDALLQHQLGIRGTVTFESHTNLGNKEDIISGPMDQMALDNNARAGALGSKPSAALQPRRRARGKGNRADQFCIYRTSDGQNIPAIAIEYKAPHKLSVDEVVTGLESEIDPERDVINQDEEGYAFTSRRLAAAVVTQLFSYMIGKGIQFGYVCTGEVFVFLHIPDDPSIVYYSICIPKLDVMDDDETRLHRTAVAQVFAFILQALRSKPPPESWHDEADKLGTWAVEYEQILHSIPAEERKGKNSRVSLYKPRRWKGFQRSPIRTRSKTTCQQPDYDGNTDDEDPPSPSPLSRGVKSAVGRVRTRDKADDGERQQEHRSTTRQDIQTRPFCTQTCLKGLASGGSVDDDCPNREYHGQEHVELHTFLRLIRDQLARDRGRDADCAPMNRAGARGALFKVRLSSYGYTLIAKGMESVDQHLLQHENAMYNRLLDIQGVHIPVCLGNIELARPCHYDSGVYTYFMFLSWAGRPLFEHISRLNEEALIHGVTGIFKAMHNLRALHRDAELRNILCDENGKLMAVDLERAEYRGRQPLSQVSPNRKRKRHAPKSAKDEFAEELRHIVDRCRRAVR